MSQETNNKPVKAPKNKRHYNRTLDEMTDFHVEILKTQRGTLDAKEVESRINSFLGTMMINLTKVIFLEGTKSAMIIMTHMVHHAKSKVIGNNKT